MTWRKFDAICPINKIDVAELAEVGQFYLEIFKFHSTSGTFGKL